MYPEEQSLRQWLAAEAARLIYEEGYRDYRIAKQKAAQRLGASKQRKHQPSNEEIEQALRDYIRLTDTEEQRAILRHHREIALEALDFLQDFCPYLTGSALEGTSGEHSAVTLHLAANRAEDVIFFMEEKMIPFQIHERKIKSSKKEDYLPLLRFYVDEVEVELIIFTDDGHYQHSALSNTTGKGIRRADYKKLQEIIAADAAANTNAPLPETN